MPEAPVVCALGGGAASVWDRCVRAIVDFARAQQLETRDALVVLPFAQHLALAEAAWAALPGAPWMPRFETTETLARRAAPPGPAARGAPSFDMLADSLEAARQLRTRVPRALSDDTQRFEAIVRRVVEAAHALARARLALPPSRRPAWLEAARRELPASAASAEAALAAFALQWSTLAEASAAEALHASTPSARIALRFGAVDPAVAAWMEADLTAPALWLDADLPIDDIPLLPDADRRLTTCRDFEDEAQRAAAQVLAYVAQGDTPVALIALDRVLLRRVRALLDRQAVAIDDESGWMLSTTRAGAAVVALLQAAQPAASTDDWLDAMTAGPTAAALGLHAFEAWLRRHGIASLARIDTDALDARWQPLWRHWLAIADALPREASLGGWLHGLHEALRRAGLLDALRADDAGAQVLDALRLDAGWPPQLAAIEFDAPGFSRWVRTVLEAVAFKPPAPMRPAQVVITPLARAALRPFAAVVCPGADAAHLGAPRVPSLLPDAVGKALGLPTEADRREAERRSFAQLLRVPRASFFVRHSEGAERVLPAAALLELAWAAERAGRPLAAADEARSVRAIAPAPAARSMPRAPALLPHEINATAYEAMRACPYRYFALRMLKLAEAEELDDAVDAREHGQWLHALLKDFHERRDPAHPGSDPAHLAAAAREAIATLARDDEDFLPFELAFASFAPRYLAWLREQEAAGWQVRQHEWPLALDALRLPGASRPMPAWRGRIDRVDEQGRRLRILDYKASAASGLKTRVRQPLEDTQLAFYAALLSATEGEPPGGLEAAYLALDTSKSPELVVHEGVEASGAALLEGLADDFERLADGAALPALGEGRACEHCAARGLCRRDFWADEGPAR